MNRRWNRNKWFDFWQQYRLVDALNDDDLLYQVGTTVGGKVIAKEKFDAIIDDINRFLQINSNDHILDMCCGNGIITFELSKTAKNVIGIDFSSPLIETAKRFKQNENIRYINLDVTKLDILNMNLERFNKILLYGSLAYFNPSQLRIILNNFTLLNINNLTFFIGGILDKSRKWGFFNTPKRKIYYLINILLLRKDPGIGRWWSRNEIKKIANECGYKCEFFVERPILHTSHYRIDALLIKGK
jgi:SAM-dependent methyltransferase